MTDVTSLGNSLKIRAEDMHRLYTRSLYLRHISKELNQSKDIVFMFDHSLKKRTNSLKGDYS